MALVLYRKYRPQRFSEVIGQEHVVRTLTNALSRGMISHAYLFCGPRGSGKTTIARLLAKAINCEDKTSFEPCNKCSFCLEIMEGRSMDIIEIDAASNRGIEDIKELRQAVRFAPSRLKYKVYILDEAHQLSKDAANALLKTLEEPPSHAVFILATTEIHKMIPTIISRCQRFDFRKLTVPEIIRRLEIIVKNEKASVDKSALELIALNADGSIRDAESLLNQVLTFAGVSGKTAEITSADIKNLLGLVEIQIISQFVDFLTDKKAGEAVRFLGEIIEKGTDINEFAKALINYLRHALVLKMTEIGEYEKSLATGLTREEFQTLAKQAEKFKMEDLRELLGLLIDAENKMRYASIPPLPLELVIAEFCSHN